MVTVRDASSCDESLPQAPDASRRNREATATRTRRTAHICSHLRCPESGRVGRRSVPGTTVATGGSGLGTRRRARTPVARARRAAGQPLLARSAIVFSLYL